MYHISADITAWAALILSQIYLLKYRLFDQTIDKVGAALCTVMAAIICIAEIAANFIT